MSLADRFEFTDSPTIGADAFMVRIPAGVASAEELLQILYEVARLPGYFGFNWNALYDCLRDWHWVRQHQVVLLHADVPKMALQDWRSYVEVLADSVASWRPGEQHSLRVVFPIATRLQFANLR